MQIINYSVSGAYFGLQEQRNNFLMPVGGDFMVNSRKETGLAIEALVQQLKVKDQQIDRLLKQLSKNK